MNWREWLRWGWVGLCVAGLIAYVWAVRDEKCHTDSIQGAGKPCRTAYDIMRAGGNFQPVEPSKGP